MSKTDTNVIVSQYKAQFRAEPFERPRWRIDGGLQHRETYPRRRRHTVVVEFTKNDNFVEGSFARASKMNCRGHIHPSNLIDQDASILFIADAPGSRYGTAVVVEQVGRWGKK